MSDTIPAPQRARSSGHWNLYEHPLNAGYCWPYGCVTQAIRRVISQQTRLGIFQWCAEAFGGKWHDRLPMIGSQSYDGDREPIFGCDEARYAIRMTEIAERACFATEEDRLLFLLRWSDAE